MFRTRWYHWWASEGRHTFKQPGSTLLTVHHPQSHQLPRRLFHHVNVVNHPHHGSTRYSTVSLSILVISILLLILQPLHHSTSTTITHYRVLLPFTCSCCPSWWEGVWCFMNHSFLAQGNTQRNTLQVCYSFRSVYSLLCSCLHSISKTVQSLLCSHWSQCYDIQFVTTLMIDIQSKLCCCLAHNWSHLSIIELFGMILKIILINAQVFVNSSSFKRHSFNFLLCWQ